MGGGGTQTKMKSMRDSLTWIEKGGAGGKFGIVDATKVASMGHSCGGLESYAASYHDKRVTQTILLNSAVLDDSQRYLLQELTAPVALFIGGPKDLAYDSVSFHSHSKVLAVHYTTRLRKTGIISGKISKSSRQTSTMGTWVRLILLYLLRLE